MKRILVIGVNWLGDSLFITPVFKALKSKFPDSYLGVMVVERVKGVFQDNPYIDQVIVFDEKGQHKSFFAKLKFIQFLKNKKFDTAFFIHRSFTRVLVCFLAGIESRIGYQRLKNSFVLNKKIDPPKGVIHRQDHYLYLFEKTGIIIEDKLPSFFIPEGIKLKISSDLESLKEKYNCLIGINPLANWDLKRWPRDYFANLADSLAKDFKAAIIFVGTEAERAVIEEIQGIMKQDSFNFCGKTNLKELGALMQNLKLFISNDSGPAHLAASLGVNTVVIFGPTSAEITAPLGGAVKVIRKDIDCQIPCYKLDCQDNICLKDLGVEEVYSQARSMLGNG
ncbi:MAG: lipopolysaccharide heptosyltransferase II [Candidatus Omnitrophica bacterium]|nr:lipopolysaccharide heptosyltransferase II [Candidatus Omnitrophota bacterium]